MVGKAHNTKAWYIAGLIYSMFGSISLIHYLNKHLLSTHSVAGIEDKRMSKTWSGPQGRPQNARGVEEKTRKSPDRAWLQWA